MDGMKVIPQTSDPQENSTERVGPASLLTSAHTVYTLLRSAQPGPSLIPCPQVLGGEWPTCPPLGHR